MHHTSHPSTNGRHASPKSNGHCNNPLAPQTTGTDAIPMDLNGETASPATGRDRRGRFAKGHKFARGNPFHRRLAHLRQAFTRICTVRDMEHVARQLVALAKDGDHAATALLLLYTLGKPATPVEPDEVDQHEWSLTRKASVDCNDVIRVGNAVPLNVGSSIARVLHACTKLRMASESKSLPFELANLARNDDNPAPGDPAVQESVLKVQDLLDALNQPASLDSP
jgi:hypothetical protein